MSSSELNEHPDLPPAEPKRDRKIEPSSMAQPRMQSEKRDISVDTRDITVLRNRRGRVVRDRFKRSAGIHQSRGPRHTDSIGWYLGIVGRVPLLSPAEEIELAHHVRQCKELQQLPPETLTSRQRRQIRMGQRARDRMMAANLRLVMSVAKKYQNQGLELLDLVQEGAIGLERAVDKFDPGMGYKFSTYAYWWIRRGITRAIDTSARTIRLPIQISEKLSKLRRITRELSYRLGRQPNRLELAQVMGMKPEELEELLAQTMPCASLDAHARREDERSTLGELIADPAGNVHLDSTDSHLKKERLVAWIAQLNAIEQKILRLRFGLEGEEPMTLSQIERLLNVQRERVRQLEFKAITKLRIMSNLSALDEDSRSDDLEDTIASGQKGNFAINVTSNEQKPEDMVASWLGPTPPSDSIAWDLTPNHAYNKLRQDVLSGCVRTEQLANLFDGSPAHVDLHDLVNSRKLLELTDQGVAIYPLFQFDPLQTNGIVNGLDRVLAVLDFPPLVQAAWLQRPHPALDGQSPIELLKRGHAEQVVAAAQRAGHGQD